MTTFAAAVTSVREVEADLLIVPVFAGEDAAAGLKEIRLGDVYAAAKLTGKRGENLLVPRRASDRFAAGAVLLVGVGAKDEFDHTAMRRSLAKAMQGARRFATVATTFAHAFGAKDTEAVQVAVEAIGLGAYRFDRYRTAPRPTSSRSAKQRC